MNKNINVWVFLMVIITTVLVQGQTNDDEFIKFLENKEIKSYSKAGRALMDYYVKIGLIEAIENKEESDFDCVKVPSYQKKIEKLKLNIKKKKEVADIFVEEVKEVGDEKKKDYYKRLNSSIDDILNSHEISMAGYIHDHCE